MLRVLVGLLLGLFLGLPLPASGAPSIGPTTLARAQPFLSGQLGGNAQLEGGCDWLDAVGSRVRADEPSRYEPLWPEGYSVAFNPVRLRGPDGRIVAKEGDLVTVAGRIRADILTFCQVGPVYEVQRILTVNGRFIRSG